MIHPAGTDQEERSSGAGTINCPALLGEVWLQEMPKAGVALLFQPCSALAVGWAGTKGWQIPTQGTEARARD